MPNFRVILAMIGVAFFYGLPVLLLVLVFLLIRARRRGELAPPLTLMAGCLLGVSTLGVTLFLLGGGPGRSSLAWAAPAVLVAAAVLCGWLLRRPLTRPLKIVSWALFFDTLFVAAFMPFAIWIANEALQISAYSNTNESAVRTALAKNPDDPAAHSSLGMIDNRRGDRAGAMAEWRQVLRVEPDNVDALLLLGAALTRAGKVDEARPLFQRLAARDDGFSPNARKRLARHGTQ